MIVVKLERVHLKYVSNGLWTEANKRKFTKAFKDKQELRTFMLNNIRKGEICFQCKNPIVACTNGENLTNSDLMGMWKSVCEEYRKSRTPRH